MPLRSLSFLHAEKGGGYEGGAAVTSVSVEGSWRSRGGGGRGGWGAKKGEIKKKQQLKIPLNNQMAWFLYFTILLAVCIKALAWFIRCG
jgi:hypothetical protein